MLNSAILMGRLTADPELRHTSSNIAVTSFTLAVNRSYSKNSGEKITDFIDIVAWRTTAEFICKYFNKGQLVAVQGSLQTRSYQDKDGNKRKAYEILADSVHFAESKKDSGYNHETNDGSQEKSESTSLPYSNGDNDEFKQIPMDDDLPF